MIDRPIVRLAAALLGIGLAGTLAACSGGTGEALSPTLSTPMNQPGAALNRVDALYMINDYRSSQGVPPLRGDSVLEASAQSLAGTYAKSNTPPALPKGIDQILASDDRSDFATTFGEWKADPNDSAILLDPTLNRAGLGVAYDPQAGTSVYWVLLFGR